MRATTIAAIAALAIVGALSIDPSPPGAAAAALIAPQGPQSFPGDAGIEETKSGCCSHHGGCNGGTGHQLCRDGQDSPSCGGNRLFGEIVGDVHPFMGCDFENENGIVEPRPAVRDNFARAIFYMHREYGLPIDATMLPILIKWNKQDPVNQTER